MNAADNAARSLRYTHDPVGRVLSEHQDGAELLLHRQAGTIARQTDYDPQGRIRRQAAYRTTTREQVFARGYNYDSVSNITSIEDATRGEFAFRYDERDRLRSAASADHEERFAFDPASTVLVGVDNPRDSSVEHGLLRMRGDCHYDYDDAGNRIAMRRGQGGAHQFRYVYNDDNRLIEVHETRGRTRRLTRFAYDALGRRVSKAHRETIEAANTPSWSVMTPSGSCGMVPSCWPKGAAIMTAPSTRWPLSMSTSRAASAPPPRSAAIRPRMRGGC
ncbi:RHS repeat domain-containing protein [Microbacterium lacticum]